MFKSSERFMWRFTLVHLEKKHFVVKPNDWTTEEQSISVCCPNEEHPSWDGTARLIGHHLYNLIASEPIPSTHCTSLGPPD